MIPMYLSPLANHLWQSTLFAAVVLLLALALRKNHAQARYWLWLDCVSKVSCSVLAAGQRRESSRMARCSGCCDSTDHGR